MNHTMMNGASSVDMCGVRADAFGGEEVYALQDVEEGQIVLRDHPVAACGLELVDVVHTFRSLTPAKHAVLDEFIQETNVLDSAARDQCQRVARRLEMSEEEGRDFERFYALMKVNGHAVPPHVLLRLFPGAPSRKPVQEGWGLYRKGKLANHSCSPNVGYRNVDGDLVYTTLRKLRAGESLHMSYIDCLYASTPYRQRRLMKVKGFWCLCERCQRPTDPSRAFPCPKCTAAVTPTRISQSSGPDEPGEWQWRCDECGHVREGDELHKLLDLERRLERKFEALKDTFIEPDVNTWRSAVSYFVNEIILIVGRQHWLYAAAHHLISRLFAGLSFSDTIKKARVLFWEEGGLGERQGRRVYYEKKVPTLCGPHPQRKTWVTQAMDSGKVMFDFVQSRCPDVTAVAAAPWAGELMRVALLARQADDFLTLANRYLTQLVHCYGSWEAKAQALQRAFDHLQAHVHSKGGPRKPLDWHHLSVLACIDSHYELVEDSTSPATTSTAETAAATTTSGPTTNVHVHKAAASGCRMPATAFRRPPIAPSSSRPSRAPHGMSTVAGTSALTMAPSPSYMALPSTKPTLNPSASTHAIPIAKAPHYPATYASPMVVYRAPQLCGGHSPEQTHRGPSGGGGGGGGCVMTQPPQVLFYHAPHTQALPWRPPISRVVMTRTLGYSWGQPLQR
ncbi:unnamed protein product [Vitrella brassicaformis CCMP3155]|uniref:SET domain-containing protein n=2 Tax=Vitrella brassicaformis TaxID=1169539 RepID=A0A0G4G6N5_VITBC|nr:unnamed protein product [Vitrella brassicaformis CCMP3155]|eukprot:CEM24287.1 unnamed protein product [Vitrella brassicaformis CCMP3155]